MRTVRMKHGGFHPRQRQDGRVWPAFNDTISVGDEEAADLVTAGIAVYEEDEPEPVNEGFDTLRVMLPDYREPEDGPEDPDEDDEDDGNEDEGDEEDPAVNPDTGEPWAQHEALEYEGEKNKTRSSAKRPATTASKDVWAKYAISQGEPEKSAQAMTKNDLIGKYGASL